MPHNKIQHSKISRFKNNEIETVDDLVAVELPLEIRLGYADQFTTLVITMCSPEDIEDLVYGYLYSEGIIIHINQVENIEVFDAEFGLVAEVRCTEDVEIEKHLSKRQSVSHSSCGVCGKTEIDTIIAKNYPKICKQPLLSSSQIFALSQQMKQQQGAFQQTGGVHACALYNEKANLLSVKEDIGRHNALDKLIGESLVKGLLPLSKNIILLSGRVSYEMIHKSLMSGVSHLVAIGAPSSLSIELAKVNNLHLYGFVKNDSYNVYC
ncbi:MAG TPA: formate dehydrogenase accessory sulfurtransferase FdhD [Gammaproteobacteria bacterium]|nr:formate dehydrogenase accessory sulfurtransferase FdhD [Xanthomonadales bacterium]MCB1593753.1 formate dehydrogenase accessory sulfurtransferase FdhD [Xanthomonadales bacterium]HOP22531.1 formate dehydrogenase accessory sulfurtransferase FdhD [Gammaproteobacteria bacterium]HPI95180.1 formate dehydrogenase accessory sulfurtransferase FdhD [Gammaproteobacteria bacterium]HPQ86717.1 formate dehydrogenase accessory sulfurtransferase FdhD [Gammaproteobacteria bacterium]